MWGALFWLVVVPAATLVMFVLGRPAPPPVRRCGSHSSSSVARDQHVDPTLAAGFETSPQPQSVTTTTTTTREAAAMPPGAVDAPGAVDSEAASVQRWYPKRILIAYATQTHTSRKLAHQLFTQLTAAMVELKAAREKDAAVAGPLILPEMKVLELVQESASQCTIDTLLEDEEGDDAAVPRYSGFHLVVFIVSTYTEGVAPDRSRSFELLLNDAVEDHRVARSTLARKRFAILGLGDIAYGDQRFNQFAKNLYRSVQQLGGKFVIPPCYATENKTNSLFSIFAASLIKWLGRTNVLTPVGPDAPAGSGVLTVQKAATKVAAPVAVPEEAGPSRVPARDTVVQALDSEDDADEGDGAAAGADEEDGEGDIEDVVTYETDLAMAGDAAAAPDAVRELLYPRLRDNLSKQGYTLVGSHSGVKLCRWTKSMLRGRGGCYKHTFYNISSFQCMEMTPNLACANKCIFCWRHHTNPVSRTFAWRVDDPYFLVDEGIKGHRRMIKMMKGVPGVLPERLEEAMTVRHCALSLVGEPIMYPEINAFVDYLHQQRISSFMVTNAQFPEQLRDLHPVTQLYLSIDAPTKDELKRIDRPLFSDFWERCIECIRILKDKRQRTVFRLTLVNEYNVTNVEAYAELVKLGRPDFIEVKGVTYCGTNNASELTMKENVPYHVEVVSFCQQLCDTLRDRDGSRDGATAPAATAGFSREREPLSYRIACEHEHSCCVLISHTKFFIDNAWHTWIDYDKFFQLVGAGPGRGGRGGGDGDDPTADTSGAVAVDGATTARAQVNDGFTALDYCMMTPAWAQFDSAERGFDPAETRHTRKSGKPVVVTSSC